MQALFNGHTIISVHEGFTVEGSFRVYPKTVEGLLALTEDLK